MRRVFIPTLVAAICAAGALAPGSLAGKPAAGLSITNVTGWSDQPVGADCAFHVVISWTGTMPKGGAFVGAAVLDPGAQIASVVGSPPSLGPSAFTLNGITGRAPASRLVRTISSR
jgi:hypothetical protein